METKQITINDLAEAIKEICANCPDGSSGWCGGCHIDELAAKFGIEDYN